MPQTKRAKLLIGIAPPVEAGPAHAKIPACLAGIPNLLGMLQNSKLSLNLMFFVCHQNFLHPISGNLTLVKGRLGPEVPVGEFLGMVLLSVQQALLYLWGARPQRS